MQVVYEDNSILVIDKPAGIAVQTAGVGARDLESEIKRYRKSKGERPEIYVVHRLDQPVSGLIVFAKTKEAAAALSREMANEGYVKDYEATVYTPNTVLKDSTLTDYIVKDSKSNMAVITDEKEAGAKKAVLQYEVKCVNGDETKLFVHLKTGRFHQIRAQLANLGTPILGDRKYGTKESIAYSDDKNIKNVMLRACHLSFKHPDSGKTVEFSL